MTAQEQQIVATGGHYQYDFSDSRLDMILEMVAKVVNENRGWQRAADGTLTATTGIWQLKLRDGELPEWQITKYRRFAPAVF